MLICAVDLDGLLLSFPDYFQFFFHAMQSKGAKVGILTGRPESEKEAIEEALAKVGFRPDFFVAMPDKMKQLSFSSGIYKALVCNYLGVDVLYDDFQSDDPTMMGDFFTYNQRTVPFTSFAYNPTSPEKPEKKP